jgi:hypothetical protein
LLAGTGETIFAVCVHVPESVILNTYTDPFKVEAEGAPTTEYCPSAETLDPKTSPATGSEGTNEYGKEV